MRSKMRGGSRNITTGILTRGRGRNNTTTGLSGDARSIEPDTIFLYMYSIVVTIILIANLVVFFAFLKMKKRLKAKIPNILLMNQAIVDFVIGLTSIPRIVCFGDCVEANTLAYYFFAEYTMFLAVATLLVSTVERFMCVKYPFIHHTKMTKGKIIIMAIFAWLLTLPPGFINVFYVVKFETRVWNYYIATATILLLAVATIFILLGMTYHAIRYAIRERIMAAQSSGSSTSTHVANMISAEQKKQSKVTKVFLIMSIIYTVTILPLIIGQLVLDSLGVPRRKNYIVKTSLYLFYISSAMIDPILTLVCKPDYTDVLLWCKKEVLKGRGSSQVTEQSSITEKSL